MSRRRTTGRLRPPLIRPVSAARLRTLLRVATRIIGWQTVTQLVGVAAGLLLLRWLTISSYAQYTFAIGFGSMISQLVDVGFADSVTGLVGDRAGDPRVVGSYLQAARSLRWLMCAALLPISAIPFFLLGGGHGWALTTELLLYATVVGTLTTRAMVDYYSIPLVIDGRLSSLYGTQLVVALARLALTGLLKIATLLRGWSAAAISCVGLACTGLIMRRRASDLVEFPDTPVRAHRTEILRMVFPLLPGQLVFVLQGQLTIVVASTFDQNLALAQVGAVARFGQAFAVLTALNSYALLPRLARAASDRVRTIVLMSVGGMAFVLTLIVAAGFSFPHLLTLVLGNRYRGLGYVAGWALLSQALACLDVTIYTINVARKYVWWWSTLVQAGLILSTDLVILAGIGVHTVLEIQYLAVAAGVASFVGAAGSTFVGARAEARRAVVATKDSGSRLH